MPLVLGDMESGVFHVQGFKNPLGKESIEGHFRHPLDEDTLDIDRNTVDPILTGMVGGAPSFALNMAESSARFKMPTRRYCWSI